MIRNISGDGPGTQRGTMTRDGDCFSSQLRVRGRSLQERVRVGDIDGQKPPLRKEG